MTERNESNLAEEQHRAVDFNCASILCMVH